MHILCKNKKGLHVPNMFMIAKNAVKCCKHAVDAGSQLAFETQPMCQVVFFMIKNVYLTTNKNSNVIYSAYANIHNL